MAKKRKKSTTKRRTKTAREMSGFWRGVASVGLIIAGIVLAFGAFTNADVPHSFWTQSWSAVGGAAVLAPLAFIYLGSLKLLSEDHRIPIPKVLGVGGLLIFLSSWLEVTFSKGGGLGSSITSGVEPAFGGILTGIIFFVLALIALLFTFAIDPRVLLKILELFRREPKEGEEDSGRTSEDLAALKSKMGPGFKLNEGVPVEHHSLARMSSLRNAAQKLAPDQDHAALTIASDPDWQFPPMDLLSDKQDKADAGDVQANAEIIKSTFANFNINVDVEGANVGPRVTQFTLKPPTGVKLTKLTALENNLALDLAAHSIIMEAPIPGKRAVGIEVPNVKPATVTIHSLLASSVWHELKSPLAFAIGKGVAGSPVVADLEKMPHLLIAGQTGSGKSVMINTFLTSLLYRNSPSDLKLILVDPKQVEMTLYKDIPHLLAPVITEPEKCISALKWAVAEMERRLKTFSEVGKRNINEYNSLKREEGMPYVVIVIDELADLMMMAARDVEALVVRLAQKARAAGIHLVIATQRPSVDVITGLIKANVPARIAFTVVSQVDSRTIIDQAGAEKLLGSGDLLFNAAEFTRPKRVQGAFISDAETHKVTDFLRAQRPPNYNDEVVSQPVQLGKGIMPIGEELDDSAWRQAVEVVIANGKASTSLLQRKLRIGYGRASRLIDIMEERGIISPADGSRPREVLVHDASQVFGDENSPPSIPDSRLDPNSDGDVYDDMPDK